MIVLRWSSFGGAVWCAVLVVQTGLSNGLVLLGLIFLAVAAVTFRSVQDLLVAVFVWLAAPGVPCESRVDHLDGQCPCPVDHAEAEDCVDTVPDGLEERMLAAVRAEIERRMERGGSL